MNNPKLFDAHVHVETAEATPMAVLEIARQKELKIGLVDHIFQDRNRVTPDEIKSACRKDFPDVYFLHGCEVDAYSPGKIALKEEQRAKMDFIIVSFTHFSEPGPLLGVDVSSKVQIGERLLELLQTAIEYPHTDIIGHPFSFLLEGVNSWQVMKTIPQDMLVRELRKARDRKIAIEINARTLRNNDTKPQEYFINLANQEGCIFSIGSDAHCLEDVGRTEEAWELIHRFGIMPDKIVFPKKRSKKITGGYIDVK